MRVRERLQCPACFSRGPFVFPWWIRHYFAHQVNPQIAISCATCKHTDKQWRFVQRDLVPDDHQARK